ncbi:MAG TPA: amino acid adenylation domain-containing protein [Gammaproteobacteria bacterium]|nr:amino acid adenylation domain-containing protein [Gammaproteobacteria bacterium]
MLNGYNYFYTGFNVTSEIDEVYVFPTTYPQKQIWFINQLNQDSPAYNIPFAYDVKGNLDMPALQRAINEMIHRHETFRTIFLNSDDGPVQVVFPELVIDVPVKDYMNKSITEAEAEISNYIDEESVRLFDLSKGPLIRASIIRQAEQSYVLVLNFHHIILDHISIVQFAEELNAIYKAYLADESSPLLSPELQYADYAVWQKNHQTYEHMQSRLAYWETHLKGKVDYLDLPLDHHRPVLQSLTGKEYHLDFPLTLLNDIKALSRKESVSIYITLMAAYSVVLGVYSQQSEVSVGTPFANRSHQPELEKIMGCFINTIPIFTDLSGSPDFNEVLKRVRKSVFSANANQELPFEMIVEALKPKRDASYNPLFQVGFTFQEAPMEIELEGCSVRSQRLHNKSAKFDIMSWLWETEKGISGIIEYNTDIFDSATIERFAHHYQSLLEDAVKRPDVPISDLSILSETEYNRLVEQWNQTDREYNAPSSIHGLFEARVSEFGDKVAVICEDQKITYKELSDQSNQFANYLIDQGIEKNMLIGVCLERSVDMLVSIMGILKAGGCYIPLDPEYPIDRIQFMLDNSFAENVVTQQSILQQLDFPSSVKLILIDENTEIRTQKTDSPDVNVKGGDLAYIIYTSGSTGKPKGVMVPHGAVANFLSSMAENPGLESADTLLAVTTLSFDIAVLELYLPLSQGATVVLASTDEASDGDDLIDLMSEHKVSIMQATPATWRLLLSCEWEGDTSLKVLCGGEAMPRDLLAQLLPKTGQLWNMYGPTETTVWSSCYQLTGVDGPVLIGKPIANTQFYVLDKQLKPVPPGVHGELYIGGKGVTRGYLNRGDLTQESYIISPFKTDGSRLYRTGDAVKYHESGNVEYIQRIDNQVKVRGFRIEPGEIEAVLTRQSAIEHAAVIVSEVRAGDPRLVAYIVVTPGTAVTSTAIRDLIKHDLPDYMLPQHIVEIEKLPLTPNGKVDKNALPDVFTETGTGCEDKVLPASFAQKQLAIIWAEALGIDVSSISIYDNFFDIGGHSLLSMQVISKVRGLTGVKLNPREIILSSLEHMAEQCGFKGEDGALQTQEKPTKNKSIINSVFSKIFGKQG